MAESRNSLMPRQFSVMCGTELGHNGQWPWVVTMAWQHDDVVVATTTS